MKSSCQNINQDLLLELHGELGCWKRVALLWHLQRCPECRQHKARLEKTTLVLRNVIGKGPTLRPATVLRLPVVLVAVFAAVLIAGLLANRSVASSGFKTNATATHSADGCDAPKIIAKTPCGTAAMVPKPK